MLGGSVVVESVFALPGLGRLAYEAVVQRDLNTLLGIVFVSALLVIAVNFVVDLLYARLDPRIGAGAREHARPLPPQPRRARRPAAAPPRGGRGALGALPVPEGSPQPRGPAPAMAASPTRASRSAPTTPGATSRPRSSTARASRSLIGLVATLISIAIGIVVGALAGYYGGWVDDALMRVAEAFQTLPNFLLLLVFVAVFGSDITTVTVAIGLVSWPAPARLTRAEFLTLRSREFVAGLPGPRHARREDHLPGDPAERAAARDRLRERRHGDRHPAGERPRLPRRCPTPTSPPGATSSGPAAACCGRNGTSRPSRASRSCSPCSPSRSSGRA